MAFFLLLLLINAYSVYVPMFPDSFESQINILSGIYVYYSNYNHKMFIFLVVSNVWKEAHFEIDWNQKAVKIIQGMC